LRELAYIEPSYSILAICGPLLGDPYPLDSTAGLMILEAGKAFGYKNTSELHLFPNQSDYRLLPLSK
jgi:hypothetical protein